jgi:predicted ester cyclase
MTREQIVTLFARRHQALIDRDAAALAMMHGETSRLESPTAGGAVRGRPAIEKVYEAWFTAFPNLEFNSEELLIDGDRVADVGIFSGTHKGSFMGLPPTDRPFRVPAVILCTIRDGEILDERRVYDFTGLMLQIGVLKARPV